MRFTLLLFLLYIQSFSWTSKLLKQESGKWVSQKIIQDSTEFLIPDFSFAGYHAGEKAIPNTSTFQTITLSPVQGDNSIQINKAIRKLSHKKPNSEGVRGRILLKEGTWELQDEIRLSAGGIVLSGEGTTKTFLYVNSTTFARKAAIHVSGPNTTDWQNYQKGAHRIDILQDVELGAKQVQLKNTHGLKVGDAIIVRQWPSMDFSLEHGANGINLWPASIDKTAPRFCRIITEIKGNTVLFDEPIRYPLKTKYGAHVFKTEFIDEVGIENFSIGFVKGPDTDNNGSTHRAAAILMHDVKNSWIRNVNSYKRDEKSVHLQSYGISLRANKWVTVKNCTLQSPQNKNVGGNGYLFNPVLCDAVLFENCTGIHGRHNFVTNYSTNGTVFLDCTSKYARDDFHQFLSPENLYDNFTMELDSMSAGNRGDKSQGSWWTCTKPVFWNVHGSGAIYLNAWGSGYLIGSSPDIRIGTGPKNRLQDYGWTYLPKKQWIEQGEGKLEPASLYRTQLKQRLAK